MYRWRLPAVVFLLMSALSFRRLVVTLLLAALAVGAVFAIRIRGSLLSPDTILLNMKTLADSNHDNVLTPREIRKALVLVVRNVIAQDTAFDVNGDGSLNRTDISDAVRAFRALLTAVCGNGTVDSGEQCDGGDGCTATCTYDILGCITTVPHGTHGQQQFSGKMRLPPDISTANVWLRMWECPSQFSTCSYQSDNGVRISFPNSSNIVSVRGDGSFVAQGLYDTGEHTFYLVRYTNGQWDGVIQERRASASCPTLDYPVCGNGQKETGEYCDWAQDPVDFGNFSCSTYNFSGGEMSCVGNCGFSTERCVQ